MKRHADLHFLGAALRLKPGEEDIQGAAKQWEDILGVKAQGAEASRYLTACSSLPLQCQ